MTYNRDQRKRFNFDEIESNEEFENRTRVSLINLKQDQLSSLAVQASEKKQSCITQSCVQFYTTLHIGYC